MSEKTKTYYQRNRDVISSYHKRVQYQILFLIIFRLFSIFDCTFKHLFVANLEGLCCITFKFSNIASHLRRLYA